VILTRKPTPDPVFRERLWDGRSVGDWARELEGAAVINLAGALVDRRPSQENIELLTQSRVEPTRTLCDAAASCDRQPRVWIQMSTLAAYGDAGDRLLDEAAPIAEGPPQMAGVARAWESAADGAVADRKVTLRTGIVLDADGPALRRLAGVVRWGLGGRIGSGKQWISWLHVDDFLAILRTCLETPELAGIVHATSPNPVRNADMMTALRRVLRRPMAPPTPSFLVHVGAVFLRTDPALALTGRRAIPKRLLDANFEFKHPDIEPALRELLSVP
jgi:uncharacterized protein (TIGR01777 family)